MSNLYAWLKEKKREKKWEEIEHFLVILPRLFLQGGQVDKLCSLLSNYDFIEAKINHHHPECGVEALIKDYDLIDHIDVKLFKYGYQSIKSLKLIQTIQSLKLIQGALRLSTYILIKYPKQLAGQLSGRLLSFDTPEIKNLLQQIPQTQVRCLRSLRATLNPPDGLLISTFIGHTDSVNAVAVTPDGKFIISGSSDSTVKVWDLNTNEELLLEGKGHSSPVNALAVTPDGKKVISGASDNTVIVWSLEKRKKIGTFEGHSSPVNALAITPDGKTVVSASIAKKNSIKVWDLENENCQEKLTLKGHGDIVRTLAITSSNRVISASDNGNIKVWDLTNGKTLFTLQHGHKTLPGFTFVGFESPLSFVTPGFTGWASEAVYTIAVTRDGKRLISASGSGDNNTNSIKVWDLETGKEKSTLEGHKNPISALAITPNDKQVISASFDNTIKIWDIESGKEILTFIGHDDSIYDIAITLDGNKMISGSKDKTIKIWKLDPYNKHIQLTGNDNSVNDITITSDGKQVIFGLQDNTIKFSNLEENNLYDNFYSKYNIQDNIIAKTRKIFKTYIGLSSRIFTKIVSIIPIWLFSLISYFLINNNNFLILFLTLGLLILLFSILNRLYLFIRALYYTDYSKISSRLLNVYKYFYERFFNSKIRLSKYSKYSDVQIEVNQILESKGITGIAIASNNWLACINNSIVSSFHFLTVWNYKEKKKIFDLLSITQYCYLFLSILIYIIDLLIILSLFVVPLDWFSRIVWLILLYVMHKSLHFITRFMFYESVTTISISPDGKYLFSGSTNKTLKVWNLQTKKILFVLKNYFSRFNEPTTITITPDGEYLISSYKDKTIRVWNLKTKKILFTLEGHEDFINTVTITPDGKYLISGSKDKTIKIWNLKTKKEIFTLKGHTDSINAIKLTSNGKLVISASSDKTIQVWDLVNRDIIATFTGESAIKCCAVAPDDVTIVASDISGQVHYLRLEGIEM